MTDCIPPGLSQRAGHTQSQLHELHGSLYTVKCTGLFCNYVATDNYTDPISPALALPQVAPQPEPAAEDKTGEAASKSLAQALDYSAPSSSQRLLNPGELDIADPSVSLPRIPTEELPQCPQCTDGLLRPGVVWFGEPLPEDAIQAVDTWMDAPDKIDLILVVGTSAAVYPAARYVDVARDKGAKIAVVNMDRDHMPRSGMKEGDWFFEGDASAILPEMLREVIGEI